MESFYFVFLKLLPWIKLLSPCFLLLPLCQLGKETAFVHTSAWLQETANHNPCPQPHRDSSSLEFRGSPSGVKNLGDALSRVSVPERSWHVGTTLTSRAGIAESCDSGPVSPLSLWDFLLGAHRLCFGGGYCVLIVHTPYLTNSHNEIKCYCFVLLCFNLKGNSFNAFSHEK